MRQGGHSKKLVALAQLLCDHPDELAADLMEVYGLDIGAAMESGDPSFVAALAVQLPPGCRWRVAEDPDQWWTGDRLLMAVLANDLRGLIWGMADRKRRGAPPRPIGPSYMQGGNTRKLAAQVMGRDELLEALSRPRGEVIDG